jgi:hypothetical protein
VNAIAIKVDCSDALEEDRREGLACRVREYFNRNLQMPEGFRVACYFADTDSLKKHTGGPENRGFHAWLPQGPIGFPRGVQDAIAEVGTRNLVYLHGSTCLSNLGLTMTFAHELQHFRQFASNFALWAANYLLARIAPNRHMEGVWRVPFEVEARICAKTVAGDLFERERVDEFIAERIDHAPSTEFRKDWEFVKAIELSNDPLSKYDLARETVPLMQLYKPDLKEAQRRYPNEPGATLDLDADTWW